MISISLNSYRIIETAKITIIENMSNIRFESTIQLQEIERPAHQMIFRCRPTE